MHDTLPLHPTTGLAALAVIGGRPVWPILGGAPDEPGGQQNDQTTQQQDTAGQDAEPTVQDGDDAARLAARYTPAQLASMALRYRTEAGDRRHGQRNAEQQAADQAAQAQQQATAAADQARQAAIDQLKPGLVALGLLQADDATDPARIAQQLQDEQARRATAEAETRTQQVELAVLRNATDSHGRPVYNAARMLDSRAFVQSVAALDPSAADFGAKISAAMKDAADKEASFKVAPVAARAGTTLAGGSGEANRTGQPKSLADAVAASLNPQT